MACEWQIARPETSRSLSMAVGRGTKLHATQKRDEPVNRTADQPYHPTRPDGAPHVVKPLVVCAGSAICVSRYAMATPQGPNGNIGELEG